MSTRRKFALVGAGVIGKHHGLVISQLADRIDLAAVVDIDVEKAERLAAERGGTPFASLTDAL
ncbi:MAG TPA: Gfo/Idh/MocA family oxidoreductase, partial [Actinoplanes sp.]|nr:Gfo/Idh/MocA family oxidoreductase [Actinoplanes sp.]